MSNHIANRDGKIINISNDDVSKHSIFPIENIDI